MIIDKAVKRWILVGLIGISFFILMYITNVYVRSSTFKITEKNKRFIENYEWEHYDGYKIDEGDFIIFKDQKCLECNYYLKGDTIFYQTFPEGIIKNIDLINLKIKVSSLDGNSLGSYVFDDDAH